MGTVPLTPLLGTLDPQRYGDGSKPLPYRRLERVCTLTASEERAVPAVAKAMGLSERTIQRVRAHPAVRARVAYLRRVVADRAAEDAPLALRANRIALLDDLARALARQLEENKYQAVIGVTKQGEPIVGFDRGRVAELVKTVTVLDDMTTDKQPQSATATVGVAVTMTVDQAVTKVQALLSRAAPADEGGAPSRRGYGGVSLDTDTIRNEATVLDGGHNNF